MPMYDYACASGHVTEDFRHISCRDECPACSTCGQPTTRQVSTIKTEMEYTESGGESRAYRFGAHEVESAKKTFRTLNDGNARVREDGSVVFRNRTGAAKFAKEFHRTVYGQG